MFASMVNSMKSPPSLRSSGSMEMPAAIEFGGASRAQFFAFDEELARLYGPRAENRLADFGAPGAEQARQAEDFADSAARRRQRLTGAADRSRNSRAMAASGGARRGSGSKESSRPTMSEMSSLWVVCRRFADACYAAVLQHRHAIGNLEYLAHAMRNIDDRNALRRQAAG